MAKAEYQIVYDDMLRLLESGELVPGMLLPSEHMLAEKFSLSRPTVRKAIKKLADEGRILRRQGVGSEVAAISGAISPSGRICTIAVDSIGGSPFYAAKIVHGIRDAVEHCGAVLRFMSLKEMLSLAPGEVDGVILLESSGNGEEMQQTAALARSGIPVCYINRMPEAKELAFFSVDYFADSFRLVNRLLRNGARRIGFLSEFLSGGNMLIRRRFGWAEAYRANSLSAPDELQFILSEPERLIRALEEKSLDVLYVVGGSTLTNLGGVLACRSVRIPDGMEIVCYDDVEDEARYFNLPVSYIKMPLEEMGRSAAEYLIARSADPSLTPPHRKLDSALVVQRSGYLF